MKFVLATMLALPIGITVGGAIAVYLIWRFG